MEQLIYCAIVIVLIFSLLKEREQPNEKETRVIMNDPLAECQHEVTSNQMYNPLADRQPNRNDEAAIHQEIHQEINQEINQEIHQNPEAINQKSTVIHIQKSARTSAGSNSKCSTSRTSARSKSKRSTSRASAIKQSIPYYPTQKGEFKTLITGESCKLKKSITLTYSKNHVNNRVRNSLLTKSCK